MTDAFLIQQRQILIDGKIEVMKVFVTALKDNQSHIQLHGMYRKHCALFSLWPSASSLQGKTFSIWKLNDLHNLEVFVSLLLFGEVHKEHWKTEPGMVIGLLNPNPMKQKDGYDGVSGQSWTEYNTVCHGCH